MVYQRLDTAVMRVHKYVIQTESMGGKGTMGIKNSEGLGDRQKLSRTANYENCRDDASLECKTGHER